MGKMKVVAVINEKGGVGKTTTVRNMAYVMATKFGKRVLVCDLDESGGLSDSFGLKPPEDEGKPAGIAKLLIECPDPHEVILHTAYEGIDIIPSNYSVSMAKSFLVMKAATPGINMRFYKAITAIEDEYDYCIVDCAPDVNLVLSNILTATHEVIIPAQIDIDSMKRAVATINTLNEVREYGAKNPLFLRGVLFTMVGNTRIERQGLTGDYVGAFPIFDTYIRNSAADIRGSRNEALMCDEFKKGCNVALDYDNFVAEFLGLPRMHQKGASRSAFIQKEMNRKSN